MPYSFLSRLIDVSSVSGDVRSLLHVCQPSKMWAHAEWLTADAPDASLMVYYLGWRTGHDSRSMAANRKGKPYEAKP